MLPGDILGVPALGAVAPASIEELRQEVCRLSEAGSAIFPVGGASSLDYGRPPSRPGYLVDCSRLSAVDDYPSEDLTITVEAGITLAALKELLRSKGQELPIDSAFPEQATLGGAIACNASGPRRYGYGTLRDYLIGVEVVNAKGEVVRAGGRVVKNVAGYDLMKLHTGALGTLGLIWRVTLKLRPLPEARAGLRCTPQRGTEEAMLAALNLSATRPVAVDLSSTAAQGTFEQYLEPYRLALLDVLFEGSAAAVDWQLAQLERELVAAGLPARWIYRITDESDLCPQAPRWSEGVLFRAALPAGATIAFFEAAIEAIPAVTLRAHAGSGIVYGGFSPETVEAAEAVLARLSAKAEALSGSLTVPRCPAAWKARLPIFGRPKALSLMRRVKAALDPNDTFNPGRLL